MYKGFILNYLDFNLQNKNKQKEQITMLKLVKPNLTHKEKYQEMIAEWQAHGGPYVPCIIDYDCKNPVDDLDYNAVLKVVEDYSKGNIFDYDLDYFEKSDFYFVFDNDELVGMCEIRHNLKPLGEKTIGNFACGIRPSKRKKGYATKTIELMLEKSSKEGLKEAVACHYAENEITPKILKKLGFKYRNNIMSEVSKKEIKCYTKKLND